jgi:hypothetical protein
MLDTIKLPKTLLQKLLMEIMIEDRRKEESP